MAQMIRNLPAMQETQVGKIPWGRKWQPTPVFLTEEFSGQRSLASYSPWHCKQLDVIEQLTLSFSFKKLDYDSFLEVFIYYFFHKIS